MACSDDEIIKSLDKQKDRLISFILVWNAAGIKKLNEFCELISKLREPSEPAHKAVFYVIDHLKGSMQRAQDGRNRYRQIGIDRLELSWQQLESKSEYESEEQPLMQSAQAVGLHVKIPGSNEPRAAVIVGA